MGTGREPPRKRVKNAVRWSCFRRNLNERSVLQARTNLGLHDAIEPFEILREGKRVVIIGALFIGERRIGIERSVSIKRRHFNSFFETFVLSYN